MQDQTLDSRPRISYGNFRSNIQSGREIWLIDAAATRKRVLPPGPMSGVPMFYRPSVHAPTLLVACLEVDCMRTSSALCLR